jgi:hypothetical protein
MEMEMKTSKVHIFSKSSTIRLKKTSLFQRVRVRVNGKWKWK